jgi:hypothetical protein
MAAIIDILLNEKIRARRIAGELLFCASDVSSYIGDTHLNRVLPALPKASVQQVECKDTQGRRRFMMFFTEGGLYEYLFQSRLERAKQFRRYVVELLIAERKRVVDEALLEAKLARDTLSLTGKRYEIECERLTAELERVKGFQFRQGVTTFEDYVKWVDSKLEVKQPLIAGGRWTDPETWVLSHYFGEGRYEEGYEDIVRIRSEEVDDVAPLVYRVAAADHRKVVERDAKIGA